AYSFVFVPSLIRFQGDKIILAGDILYAFPFIENGPQVTSRVFGVVRLEDSGALDPPFSDPNHIQSGVPDAGNTPGEVAVSYVYDASGKAPEGSMSHVSDMSVE